MPTNHINFKADEELAAALRIYAQEHGISLATACRDLLRVALQLNVSTHDAGWREGRTAAYRETMRRISAALRDAPAEPPK